MMVLPFNLLPLVSLLVACILSVLLLRVLLRLPITSYFSDKPDERKVHSKPIPRMGGLAIVLSFLFTLCCWFVLAHYTTFADGVDPRVAGAIFAVAVVIGIFGFLDDSVFVEVRVRHKVVAELLLALGAVYVCSIHTGPISILGFFTIPLWASQIISVLWILGIINAINIIDGVDGLAGGISLIAILTLALISAIGGNVAALTISLMLAGSVFGFLLFNMPPAKTFMGDTGSLFLGGMIAILSLYLASTVTGSRSFLIMPLIAGVPIVEVLVTMVRRYFKAVDRNKSFTERLKSLSTADNSHIHHRLMFRGFDHFETALILSLTAITLCGGAVCLIFLPKYLVAPFLIYLSIPVVLILNKLGFGGRFKKALRLSDSRISGYTRTSLIGVIDKDGILSHALELERKDDVVFLPVTEEIPDRIKNHLHAVIIRSSFSQYKTDLQKAEKLAYSVKGPIFLVTAEKNSKLAMMEFFKNGTLKVKNKQQTLRELAREMQNVSVKSNARHVHERVVEINAEPDKGGSVV
ncbi:MraY family glycosyltransferase [Chitinispirillales bacterium ANBcel5]|uniref:MraY family glycosyltransferase n=1 Tax=Cellulosispirillum alkaliphilum TaxID=3039283 RepID=UPI002A5060C1|nr:MraY family glycosyltransferase [Chitinispirillales bacterium ANBcel5]